MKTKPTESNWLDINVEDSGMKVKHGKDIFFKILCICTSLLFVYLFITLQFNTHTFLKDLGLQSSTATLIIARRASIFMLGIAVLMAGSVKLARSYARQTICLSTGITMLGLACMGSLEFMRGTLDASIATAIMVELTLGISFTIIFFRNIKVALKS